MRHRLDPDNLEAARLFERCAGGDADAWNTFREQYGPLLESIVRRAMPRYAAPGTEEAAEDLVGDTLSALLAKEGEKLRAYDPRYRPSTWLSLLAATAVRDALRRAGRFPRPIPPEEIARQALQADSGPADLASDREEAERLRQAVSTLPDRERLALRLQYEDGLRMAEAARVLRMPEGTLRSLLTRARRRLRRILSK